MERGCRVVRFFGCLVVEVVQLLWLSSCRVVKVVEVFWLSSCQVVVVVVVVKVLVGSQLGQVTRHQL